MSSERGFVNVKEGSELSIAWRSSVFPAMINQSPEDCFHLTLCKSPKHELQQLDSLIVDLFLFDSNNLLILKASFILIFERKVGDPQGDSTTISAFSRPSTTGLSRILDHIVCNDRSMMTRSSSE
jgi:hypothetical protein